MLYIHLTKPEPGSRGGWTARATAAARRRQAEKTKTTESLKGKARHRPDGRPGRSRFYERKTFGATFYGNDCNPLPAGHTPKKNEHLLPSPVLPGRSLARSGHPMPPSARSNNRSRGGTGCAVGPDTQADTLSGRIGLDRPLLLCRDAKGAGPGRDRTIHGTQGCKIPLRDVGPETAKVWPAGRRSQIGKRKEWDEKRVRKGLFSI